MDETPQPSTCTCMGSTLRFSASPPLPLPGSATSTEHGENEAAFLQLPMSDD